MQASTDSVMRSASTFNLPSAMSRLAASPRYLRLLSDQVFNYHMAEITALLYPNLAALMAAFITTKSYIGLVQGVAALCVLLLIETFMELILYVILLRTNNLSLCRATFEPGVMKVRIHALLWICLVVFSYLSADFLGYIGTGMRYQKWAGERWKDHCPHFSLVWTD
ncbi:unnamed protein product [Vitrella brassicaformis CCMP3155]|uniref:Uncharacterized protein n=2 Tax=Vitrella brassicaformis TaxID=1169539 RepID=A0A0G4GZT7_VITBC|nr:unnamed protein product [Vitrella brassicaformis CCMP3155]|eukprot:CEM36793.1 unnamed protein product [Vitrella brassicaformis CCMP3155]